MKIWKPKPPRTLWATPGLLRDCFTFTFYSLDNIYVWAGLSFPRRPARLPGSNNPCIQWFPGFFPGSVGGVGGGGVVEL